MILLFVFCCFWLSGGLFARWLSGGLFARWLTGRWLTGAIPGIDCHMYIVKSPQLHKFHAHVSTTHVLTISELHGIKATASSLAE
eukprot:SAG31_NODE_5865_length_2283_cov_4.999580_1_plen_85_part_00